MLINSDILYYKRLAKDLNKYIINSLEDSQYYQALAQDAPNERAKETLEDFGNDKTNIAQNFIKFYNHITDTYYDVPSILSPVVPGYKNALEDILVIETGRYKEYGFQYLKAPTKELQQLFLNARTVEAVHTMTLPLLIQESID